MRYWILALALGLCAFAPIYTTHETTQKVDEEFQNGYAQSQPNQFRVYVGTPNLNEMKDGEVIISSAGLVRLMFRQGQEIYTVNFSCITVRR